MASLFSRFFSKSNKSFLSRQEEQRSNNRYDEIIKKADAICSDLLFNSMDFIKETNKPKNIYYIVFFWTALYYSIFDILEQNNVSSFVEDALPNVLNKCFTKASLSPQVISSAIKFQEKTLAMFELSPIDPNSQDGMVEILNLAYFIDHPNDDVTLDLPNHSTNDVFEYSLAVACVTKNTVSLLTTK